jgi:TolA-binding protein
MKPMKPMKTTGAMAMGGAALPAFAALAALAALAGCSQQGPFRHTENEVNDLKVEVFRQRQEIQGLAAKVEEMQRLAESERDKEGRFRADTQETLRQIREHTQSMSNRLDSGPFARQQPRQQAQQPRQDGQDAGAPASGGGGPDDQQLAMAEKDFNTGDFSSAVEAADNLVKYFPDSDHVPEALYIKGRALYALKAYDRAQEAFQRLCDRHPSSPRFRAARLNIGRCQSSAGNTLAAIATLEDVAGRWPSSPEARSAGDLLRDLKGDHR